MVQRALVIGFLVLFAVASTPAQELDTAAYNAKIAALLNDLVAMTSGGDQGDRVHEAVATTLEQLRANKASKYLDPDEKGILAGMKFTFHRDSPDFGLSFGPQFLDTYTKNSTTHLAILIYEMWHLRDFVKQNENFTGVAVGSRGKFWYELDAFHVEAEFIRDYLQKARTLDRFDSFVLQSFEHDSLNSVSMVLHQQSAKALFYFMDIDRAFDEKQKTGAELIASLSAVGRKRVEEYRASSADSEFAQYAAYMELLSFRNQMLKTLPLLLQNPSMTWDEVFATYPDLAYIYRESVAIEKADQDKQSAYLARVVQWWEADILTANSPTTH